MDPPVTVDHISALRASDPAARVEAARALGTLGPNDLATVTPLAEAVSDPDPDVRAAAPEALETRFLVPDG